MEALPLLLSRLTDNAWILDKGTALRGLVEVPIWLLTARTTYFEEHPELFEEKQHRNTNLQLLNQQTVEFDSLSMWKEFEACCQAIAFLYVFPSKTR